MTLPRVEAILLAAGESRRVGYPKPLLEIGGQTFVEHLSKALLQTVPRVIIVTGAFAERVRRAIPADPRITVVPTERSVGKFCAKCRSGRSAFDVLL